MRCLVIANPHARGLVLDPGLLDDTRECLASHGIAVDVHVTSRAGEATEVAAQAAAGDHDGVIAAGGDGTINEVVNGLAGSQMPLGAIPLGTGNALAYYFGLDTGDVAGACALIAARKTRRIDLGCLNGRYFVNMAGVGLDAQVARDLDDQAKSRFGRHGFVAQFFATVARRRPWECEAFVDGRPVSGPAWAVMACNTTVYAWRVSLSPEADEADGLLDFVIIRGVSKLRLVREMAGVFIRRRSALDCPSMTIVRGRRLEVTMSPPAPWQVEGEVCGSGSIVCEVSPGALCLFDPRT